METKRIFLMLDELSLRVSAIEKLLNQMQQQSVGTTAMIAGLNNE